MTDRVFLDANILVSAAWRADVGLLALWPLPATTLLTSAYAIVEADRNLRRPEQRTRLYRLVQRLEIVDEPRVRCDKDLVPSATLAVCKRGTPLDGRFLTVAHTLAGHTDVILRLSWSPDGRWLASNSVDKTIRLWDWERNRLVKSLSGHTHGVNEVAWDPAGRWLASCSFDRTVRIWSLESETTTRELPGHWDDVSSISVSPDGERLVSGSADKTIRLWRTDTWEELQLLKGHTDSVYRVAWSPKHNCFASCSKDGTTIIWDAATLQPKWKSRHTGRRSRPSSVAWSPTGRFLCVTSFDGTVSIWTWTNPEGEASSIDLAHHSDVVRSATFSPDERLLATSSGDNTVRLWRTDTWQPVAQFDEPTSSFWPQGIAFHPLHAILATFGDHDRVVRIWRLEVDGLLGETPKEDEPAYRNAKAVLLGDTGVGKSALRLVLTGEPFAPTVSTYGRRVWTLSIDQHEENGQRETRETLLWDMAGQPGYRLIHQLHLTEVAVAMLVFDARQATGDPLSSVRHWERALRQAQQRQGEQAVPLKRFLVVGRADIQGVAMSPARIEAIVRDWELDGFLRRAHRRAAASRSWHWRFGRRLTGTCFRRSSRLSTSHTSRTSFSRRRAAAD